MASPSASAATVPPKLSGHFAFPVILSKVYPSSPPSSITGVSSAVKVFVSPEVTPTPPSDKTKSLPSRSSPVITLISVTVGSGSGSTVAIFTIVHVMASPLLSGPTVPEKRPSP